MIYKTETFSVTAFVLGPQDALMSPCQSPLHFKGYRSEKGEINSVLWSLT